MATVNNVPKSVPPIFDEAEAKARERLLSVPQVAELLCLSLQAVRHKIARGEIGFCRLGERTIRIPESELMRQIAEPFVPARRRT